MQRKDQFGHERGFYKWLISPICEAIEKLSKEIAATRRDIKTLEKKMRAETQALIDEVSGIRDASDAAEALLDKIFAMIGSASDIAELQKATADLKKEKEELAAAVVRNTPAADEPPPVDPPVPIDPAARGRR